MKKIYLLSFLMTVFFGAWQVSAQCTTAPNGQWPSSTFMLSTASSPSVDITTCAYTGEYSVLNITEEGQYEFTSSTPTNFLTLTDAALTPVVSGTTPLVVDISTPGTYRLYRHDDAGCGVTTSGCRTITGEYLGPIPSGGGGGATAGSIFEDFNSGIPAGWTTVINSGTCDWYVGSLPWFSTAYAFPTDAFYFDDDACGGGAPRSDATIYSAVYDMTGNTVVFAEMSYDAMFRGLGTEALTVEVYDGGAWVEVANYTTSRTVANSASGTIDVAAYANPDFQVRFTYAESPAGWNWGAGLDNFALDFEMADVIGTVPQIICPNNITVNTSDYPADDCGAQVFFNDAQAQDAEDGLLPVTQTMGLATGSVFPIGENIIEYTTEDSDGNVATCQFTITVVDDIDPVAACQNYTIALDENGIATLDAEMLNEGFGFTCTYSIGLNDTFGDGWNSSGSDASIDVLVDGDVVLDDITLDDGFGPEWFNFEVMPGQSIEVQYTTNGTWAAENWFEVTDGPDGSGTVIYDTPEGAVPAATHAVDNLCESGEGSSDLCGGVHYSFDEDGLITSIDFECLELGENMVTLYVTDDGGNQVTCDVLVTVEDNIAPEIVCLSGGSGSVHEDFESGMPAGWSTVINAGGCDWYIGTEFVGSTWAASAGAWDLTTGNAVYFDDDDCGLGSGASNVTLMSAVYDLTDVTSAELSYDYVYRHLGTSSFSVEVFDGTDWQEIALVNADQTPTNSGIMDMMTYANASFQVRYTFDDGGGWNWGAAIDNFLLEYQSPSGSVPQYYLDANGEVAVPITDLYDSATDNCSVTVTVGGEGVGSCSSSTPSNEFENGHGNLHLLTVANDFSVDAGASFTTDELKFNLIHNPGIVPTEVDITFYEDSGAGPGAILYTETNVIPTSVVEVGTNFGFPFSEVTLPLSGQEFDGGTAGAVYWIGIQLAGYTGANSYWEGTSILNTDNQGYIDLNDGFGFQTISSVFASAPFDGVFTLSGTCGASGGANYIFTCADVGMTTVTVTATDEAGNSTSCETTVEIIDDMNPVLVTQDITVSLDENGEAIVSYEDLLASSPDEYYVVTIGGDNGSFAEGTTDLLVDVVEDAAISFDWSYVNGDLVGFDSFGYTVNGVYTQLTDPGLGDQSGSATVNLSAGDEFGFRSQTDDNAGGAGTTTITEFMPGFTGQFAPENWTEVLDNSDGSAEFVVIPGGLLAYDNCGIETGAVSTTIFTCEDIGDPITVTVFISDPSGNSTSATAEVTVVDDMGPIIECMEDMTVGTDPDAIVYTLPDYVADGDIMITDNCTDPVDNYTQDPAPGTGLVEGPHTITITATDEYGNESSCSFVVTVDPDLSNNENELINGIVLYPNPANNTVNLVNNSSIVLDNVVIADMAGKIVAEINLSGMAEERTIDISELSSGVYMVRISGQDASIVKRLVKK